MLNVVMLLFVGIFLQLDSEDNNAPGVDYRALTCQYFPGLLQEIDSLKIPADTPPVVPDDSHLSLPFPVQNSPVFLLIDARFSHHYALLIITTCRSDTYYKSAAVISCCSQGSDHRREADDSRLSNSPELIL